MIQRARLSNQTVGSNGCPLRHDLTPVLVPIGELKQLGHETRRHPKSQLKKLAASLQQFGFVLPVVADRDRRIVAGAALVQAADELGLHQVPVVQLRDLTDAQLRSLRLALNRLAEDSDWDERALQLELSELSDLDPELDLQITGFAMGQIDSLLAAPETDEDELPPVEARPPVAQPGDLWKLGEHRILCADATLADSYQLLMQGELAQMVFADPPYNVPIAGHVSGRGRITHPEFRMASGELSAAEFEAFLTRMLSHTAVFSVDGSLHYLCMDWRGLGPLLSAAGAIYTEMINLCIWNKRNGGMGSLYRSKHELVFIYKHGKAAHINNVQLGKHGRARTNVWDYPGSNSWANSPKSKLGLHPTPKPVALVADAIRDCTKEHDIVLDPFGGAGTTLIAAERTRRRSRLIEIEPRYVDVTIRRWQHVTGKAAVNAVTGAPFDQTNTAGLERSGG
ncbi:MULTISPECIES: DNA methyltransferase [unclassified Bradyrhizobium]|uniref:site-specific DNA-methyltransferase n=1 Tax=unclassified Bradyrhizobium TaxID=2631580 RepID=UPI001CD5F7B0|nr:MULTISPECIES: DNA methyltransferase [unclassified Bradyrhizobium]MCA1495198.1 ParB N-terminal domain-containing protein [Bradyrhizobium sp. NBAIM14]MCA1531006.1 ParB N-terminal domain-containing protein [Bradyrhizobium sp. NBAIM03]